MCCATSSIATKEKKEQKENRKMIKKTFYAYMQAQQ